VPVQQAAAYLLQARQAAVAAAGQALREHLADGHPQAGRQQRVQLLDGRALIPRVYKAPPQALGQPGLRRALAPRRPLEPNALAGQHRRSHTLRLCLSCLPAKRTQACAACVARPCYLHSWMCCLLILPQPIKRRAAWSVQVAI
jgi:hypothetical protein